MPSGPRRKPSEGTRREKQLFTSATKVTVSVSTNPYNYTTWAPGGREVIDPWYRAGTAGHGRESSRDPHTVIGWVQDHHDPTCQPATSLPAAHTRTQLGSLDSSPTCRPSAKQVVIPATWAATNDAHVAALPGALGTCLTYTDLQTVCGACASKTSGPPVSCMNNKKPLELYLGSTQ